VEVPFSFDVNGERYDLEAQAAFRSTDTIRTVLGAGARRDRGDSVALFGAGSPVVEDTWRAFGSAEWRPVPSTVINGGLMIEKISSAETYSSPRLAANYHVDENNTVRAAWSMARRLPTLFEQYGNEAITNPGLPLPLEYFVRSEGGLRPETIRSSELGYLWRHPEWDTTLDIRAFHDRILDAIVEVIVPTPDLYDGIAYSWRNGNDITVRGAEFELGSRLGRNDRIAISYSRMRVSAGAELANLSPSQQHQERSVPDYTGSLFLMHRFDEQWDLGITASWVGKMKWMAGSYWLGGGGVVSSHRRIDLRLARRLKYAAGDGELALVVQNAGKRYQDFVPAQYFDRRIFLTLETRFH
jgi:iron complex outermembrane receptor protein